MVKSLSPRKIHLLTLTTNRAFSSTGFSQSLFDERDISEGLSGRAAHDISVSRENWNASALTTHRPRFGLTSGGKDRIVIVSAILEQDYGSSAKLPAYRPKRPFCPPTSQSRTRTYKHPASMAGSTTPRWY